MRVTHRFLLCGMLIAPLGAAFTANVYSQDESRGQPQERGPGGPGGDRGAGRGGPGGGRTMGGGVGGSMGIASLVQMKEVRTELKMDEDQVKSLEAIRESMGGGRGPSGAGSPGGGRPEGRGDRGGPGGPPSVEQMKEMADRGKKMRAEVEGKVSDVLDPDQNSRILGLLIQLDGGRALTSSVLAAALELSPEQLTKLDDVQIANMQAAQKTMQEAMAGGRDGWTKVREQMEAMKKKSEESMLAILTSDQRSQFDSMKGEKFEFPERGPGGVGGDRGRGGDRPGGRGERPEIQ